MNVRRLCPVPGQEYTNRGGGTYICREVWENDTHEPSWCARMVNTKTGWSLIAHGLSLRADGTIEWDYSTGGRFEEE